MWSEFPIHTLSTCSTTATDPAGIDRPSEERIISSIARWTSWGPPGTSTQPRSGYHASGIPQFQANTAVSIAAPCT